MTQERIDRRCFFEVEVGDVFWDGQEKELGTVLSVNAYGSADPKRITILWNKSGHVYHNEEDWLIERHYEWVHPMSQEVI